MEFIGTKQKVKNIVQSKVYFIDFYDIYGDKDIEIKNRYSGMYRFLGKREILFGKYNDSLEIFSFERLKDRKEIHMAEFDNGICLWLSELDGELFEPYKIKMSNEYEDEKDYSFEEDISGFKVQDEFGTYSWVHCDIYSIDNEVFHKIPDVLLSEIDTMINEIKYKF